MVAGEEIRDVGCRKHLYEHQLHSLFIRLLTSGKYPMIAVSQQVLRCGANLPVLASAEII
jgi:hypothetical protein